MIVQLRNARLSLFTQDFHRPFSPTAQRAFTQISCFVYVFAGEDEMNFLSFAERKAVVAQRKIYVRENFFLRRDDADIFHFSFIWNG